MDTPVRRASSAPMADILHIHSVRGLRPAERAWGQRLEAAGHRVTLPDLFDGETAETVDGGLSILERIGWETVVARARDAAAALPADAVLSGASIGAQVAGELLADRPEAAALLLMHGPCEVPVGARPGLPVQAHLALPEPFDDEGYLADWAEGMRRAGVAFDLHRYPDAGHYFTDATLPDFDAAAADLAASRVLGLLARLG